MAGRAKATISTGTTDGEVIAAVSGKAIRVLAFHLTCAATATSATFTTKPEGAGTAISPVYTLGANGQLPSGECPSGWFETAKSEGLSLTTSGSGSNIGVLVIYDLV